MTDAKPICSDDICKCGHNRGMHEPTMHPSVDHSCGQCSCKDFELAKPVDPLRELAVKIAWTLDGDGRCPICSWPLAESVEKGCVIGNCSLRPPDGSAEGIATRQKHHDMEARVERIKSALTAHDAQQQQAAFDRGYKTAFLRDWYWQSHR